MAFWDGEALQYLEIKTGGLSFVKIQELQTFSAVFRILWLCH